MEQLEYIESLINEMFSKDCPDYQVPADQLFEWQEKTPVFTVIEYLIEFLSTRTNEHILLFAATCLRNCIIKKWDEFTPELNESLVSFLCDYIINNQNNQNSRSYIFILICFADIIVLTEDFPIQQVFSDFPLDIQIEICSYYFEEKEKRIYGPFIDQSYFEVPDDIIEYVHNILQEAELSPQWIRLYHNFAMGLEVFQPLIVYIPKLLEAVKITSLSEILIDHIKNVFNKDVRIKGMEEPDEYHFEIVNLAIELSTNLREEIHENPNDPKLVTNLIWLWDGVLYLEDEEEYFLKPEFIAITSSLIEEFTEAEKVIIDSVEMTHDIDLWPMLMITAMRFCDNFKEDCPIANFVIDVLEFILIGLDNGVQLSDIHDKFVCIYHNPAIFVIINEYFADPALKSPSLLVLIGYLNSDVPRYISEMYCNNFQDFDAPPSDQIYFATQFVEQFEEFATLFIDVFTQFFEDFPHECSHGLYLTIRKYPQLFDESAIEPLTESLNNIPFNKLEYIIPSIIFMIVGSEDEQVAQAYTNIFQIIVDVFTEALHSQNKINLQQFFLQLHIIALNIMSNYNIFNQDPNSEGFKLFINFGQQLFNCISEELQDIWMDPTINIQFILTQFVYGFLRLSFISNPADIACWLNDITASSPFSFHIRLLYFLKNYIEQMPNVIEFINTMDLSKDENFNSFIMLVQNLIPDWDEICWEIISPDIILGELFEKEKIRQPLIFHVMSKFALSPRIETDFKVRILQEFVKGIESSYGHSSANEQANLILCLSQCLGVEMFISAFSEHVQITDEEQEEFGSLISSFLFPQETTEQSNEEKEITDAEEQGESESIKDQENAYKQILKDIAEFMTEIYKRNGS